MVQTIKEVTIRYLRENEQSEINLPKFMMQLQANILVNITVGSKLASTPFPYELQNGSIITKNLGEHIDQILKDMIAKMLQPHNFVVKGLMAYNITREDHRYQRNIER